MLRSFSSAYVPEDCGCSEAGMPRMSSGFVFCVLVSISILTVSFVIRRSMLESNCGKRKILVTWPFQFPDFIIKQIKFRGFFLLFVYFSGRREDTDP